MTPYDILNISTQAQLDCLPDTKRTFDFIVLGIGSMGSSTCYHLAKRGFSVLGIEQFDIPHTHGSHTGQSRLIRKAYFEQPDYVPLLERAYQNWEVLASETGEQLYFKTGLLYFGQKESQLIKGMRNSSNMYSIEVDELSSDTVATRFPQFTIPSDFEMLLEQDAGFLAPERSILLYVSEAIKLGAIVQAQEKVIEWKHEQNAIQVKTSKAEYSCKKLIITAGPWASKMAPISKPLLEVTRQVMAWIQPKNPKSFELGNFPCWTIDDRKHEGIFYGVPILNHSVFGGVTGLKLAHHTPGILSDPDQVNRKILPEDEKILTDFIEEFLPRASGSIISMQSCLYTNSPDHNFILDFVPSQDQKVIIATGFSGHGFKFSSVIGEIMSNLAIEGHSEMPIHFLRADRFNWNLS